MAIRYRESLEPGLEANAAITRLPTKMIMAVIVICLLPFLLNLGGVDFGSPKSRFDPSAAFSMTPDELADSMHHALAGSFTHTLLEWTAFCTALFTVLLAFMHFSIRRDVTTPVIAVALFCAGSMDAFHTLAANRLIPAVANNQDLIPFTWAICRLFNALIMIIGASLFLVRGTERPVGGLRFVVIASLAFGCIAYGIIHICATSLELPRTMYPGAVVTRPYDVAPLALFIFAGIFVYPRFYRRAPSLFSHALVISAIPEVVTQIHMAFGSTALFDNHFNISHFLKVIAYLVPFSGLALDYVQTQRQEQRAVAALRRSQKTLVEQKLWLEQQTKALARSNSDLEQFAYVASHDLQEPLRMVASYCQLLQRRYKGKLDADGDEFIAYAVDGADRMQILIHDLLTFSRLTAGGKEFGRTDCEAILARAEDNLEIALEQSGAVVTHGPLPVVVGEDSQLCQLFQNLLSNAIKFSGKKPPEVHIGAEQKNGQWLFWVRDNGIGMDPSYGDRIFLIFQRLQSRDQYTGTGIGLAICKKVVENHNGRIWVETEPEKGSTFFFTIPAISQHEEVIHEASGDSFGGG